MPFKMDNILSFAQQQQLKPWAKNSEPQFAQIRNEVVDYQLTELLGVAFAQAVISTPANFTSLLTGATFTYCDNVVKHKGLRYVLAYFVYAKYAAEGHLVPTFTGFVTKQRTEAESAKEGEIRRIERGAIQMANQAFTLVDAYLCENAATYPLYKKNTKSPRSSYKIFEGIRKV